MCISSVSLPTDFELVPQIDLNNVPLEDTLMLHILVFCNQQ